MDRTLQSDAKNFLNAKLEVKEIRRHLEVKPLEPLDCYNDNAEFRFSYIDLEEKRAPLPHRQHHSHYRGGGSVESDFVGRILSVYRRVDKNETQNKMSKNGKYQIMGGCGIMLTRTTMVTSRELVKPNITINGIAYILEGVFTSLSKDLCYHHVHDLLEFKKMKKAKVLKRNFHPTHNDDPNGLLVDGFVFLETLLISENEDETIGIPALYPHSGGEFSNECYVVGYPIVEAEYQMKWKSIQEESSSLICFNQTLVPLANERRIVICGGLTLEDEKSSFRTKPLYSNVGFNEFNSKDGTKYPSYLIHGSYPSRIGMTGSAISSNDNFKRRWTFHSIHLGFVFRTDLLENVFTSNMEKPFKKLSVAIRVDTLPFMMEYANLIKDDTEFMFSYRNELRSYFGNNQQLLRQHFPKVFGMVFIGNSNFSYYSKL